MSQEKMVSKYPEHEKLSAVADKRVIVEEFVDFLNYHDTARVRIATLCGHERPAEEKDIEKLIAEFFEIDYMAFLIEKECILWEIAQIEEAFRNERENTDGADPASTQL
jgi:hypothetical protein